MASEVLGAVAVGVGTAMCGIVLRAGKTSRMESSVSFSKGICLSAVVECSIGPDGIEGPVLMWWLSLR